MKEMPTDDPLFDKSTSVLTSAKYIPRLCSNSCIHQNQNIRAISFKLHATIPAEKPSVRSMRVTVRW